MISPAITLRKIRTNFGSFQEVLIFVRIFSLVTILPVMLRSLSLPGLMKMLTPLHAKFHRTPDMEEDRNNIVRFTDYILGLNFWIYRTTCLRRSLVLYHFLRLAGFDVKICFGIRYNGNLPDREIKKLEGHAWLLYNGNIYLEKNAEAAGTYKVTYSFPDK